MAVHASTLSIPVFAEVISQSTVLMALVAVSALYLLSAILRLKGERVPVITELTLTMSRDDERMHFVDRPIYLRPE